MSILSSILGSILGAVAKVLPLLFVYNKGKDKVKLDGLKKHKKDSEKARKLSVDLEYLPATDIDKSLSLRAFKKRRKKRKRRWR